MTNYVAVSISKLFREIFKKSVDFHRHYDIMVDVKGITPMKTEYGTVNKIKEKR